MGPPATAGWDPFRVGGCPPPGRPEHERDTSARAQRRAPGHPSQPTPWRQRRPNDSAGPKLAGRLGAGGKHGLAAGRWAPALADAPCSRSRGQSSPTLSYPASWRLWRPALVRPRGAHGREFWERRETAGPQAALVPHAIHDQLKKAITRRKSQTHGVYLGSRSIKGLSRSGLSP